MLKGIIPVFIPHAGCPNLCVFCDQKRIAGSFGIPSAEELERIVLEAVSKTDRRDMQLAFYGGSFTSVSREIQKRCLDAASGLCRRGLISSVRFSARPDGIDEETLDFVLSYPVKTIELGAQSMDDNVLFLSGRGHTSEDTVRAAKLIKGRGVELVLQMMVGLPGEKAGGAFETADKLIALRPDGVRIYPVAVIEGTALCDMFRRGEYTPLGLDEAAELCGGLIELFEGAGVEVIRCGLNPSEELTREVAAGVYHPAFGELARSTVYLRRAREGIEALGRMPETLAIRVNPSCVSLMVGQKRKNVEFLQKTYGIRRITVKGSEVAAGKVEIEPAG